MLPSAQIAPFGLYQGLEFITADDRFGSLPAMYEDLECREFADILLAIGEGFFQGDERLAGHVF
ncbi:hypothetical protein DMC25_16030 [Caulobacter sp. D4A]|nr:hypothetical protein DMC25_16030 [Caulobacter sp. D4A]